MFTSYFNVRHASLIPRCPVQQRVIALIVQTAGSLITGCLVQQRVIARIVRTAGSLIPPRAEIVFFSDFRKKVSSYSF